MSKRRIAGIARGDLPLHQEEQAIEEGGSRRATPWPDDPAPVLLPRGGAEDVDPITVLQGGGRLLGLLHQPPGEEQEVGGVAARRGGGGIEELRLARIDPDPLLSFLQEEGSHLLLDDLLSALLLGDPVAQEGTALSLRRPGDADQLDRPGSQLAQGEGLGLLQQPDPAPHQVGDAADDPEREEQGAGRRDPGDRGQLVQDVSTVGEEGHRDADLPLQLEEVGLPEVVEGDEGTHPGQDDEGHEGQARGDVDRRVG
ncbi:MAG: hypothetical protein P1V51_07100 [Deltaproteobacteria bacterium]|nr:hypothetical protein [Deltaproteobacteria bacterium]